MIYLFWDKEWAISKTIAPQSARASAASFWSRTSDHMFCASSMLQMLCREDNLCLFASHHSCRLMTEVLSSAWLSILSPDGHAEVWAVSVLVLPDPGIEWVTEGVARSSWCPYRVQPHCKFCLCHMTRPLFVSIITRCCLCMCLCVSEFPSSYNDSSTAGPRHILITPS